MRYLNLTHRIPELNGVSDCGDAIKFGASVTLSRVEDACRDRIKRMKPHKTRVLVQIVEMLRWFAGKQIRNVAAVGGNIITGSPISDLNPVNDNDKHHEVAYPEALKHFFSPLDFHGSRLQLGASQCEGWHPDGKDGRRLLHRVQEEHLDSGGDTRVDIGPVHRRGRALRRLQAGQAEGRRHRHRQFGLLLQTVFIGRDPGECPPMPILEPPSSKRYTVSWARG